MDGWVAAGTGQASGGNAFTYFPHTWPGAQAEIRDRGLSETATRDGFHRKWQQAQALVVGGASSALRMERLCEATVHGLGRA